MVSKERHKQVGLKLNGEKFTVDEKLAPLIKELNKAGLVTLFSCQETVDEKLAYVMFDLDFINQVSLHDGRLVLSWRLNNPVMTKIYYNYMKGDVKK
jgi:hypothetical protein